MGDVYKTPRLPAFIADESGTTLIEYGVVLAVLAAVTVALISSIGNKTKDKFDTLAVQL
ncbi:MAG: Flp family type IVb pilin [Alphaproteobacteria bacterium]